MPWTTCGVRVPVLPVGLVLIGFFVMSRAIVHSKYGRVLQAIRDAESRVMFTGYDPVAYKLSIWTLSAVMCGVAGALYVPQVGIINPGEMSPAASIEIAIWAAVGGRATLIGPIVGAFFVNGAKSWFTVAFPEFWLFFLGALFIAVTLFLPNGLVGLFKRKKDARHDTRPDGRRRRRRAPPRRSRAPAPAARPRAAYGRRGQDRRGDFAHGVALYLDEITSASTASRR
jgi:urea transport system permease protein